MATRDLLIATVLLLVSHVRHEEISAYSDSLGRNYQPARTPPVTHLNNRTELAALLSEVYTEWGEWTKCRSSADLRVRRRYCKVPGICENTVITEEKLCNECREIPCEDHHRRRYRQRQEPVFHVEVPVGRSGGELLENKGVYSKWSVWTGCTRSCVTQRFKWCLKPSVCGTEVIKQTAYCYVEGSYCQKWIHNKVSHNWVNKEENPHNPSVGQEVPSNRPGAAVAFEGKQEVRIPCGVTGYNGTTYVPPQWNMLRIIGGRPTQQGKWPWQVAILNRFKEAFCGGTLVAQRWVLTAAHCVRKRLYVRLGEHDLSRREGTELQMRIRKSVVHPAYNAETVDNDVALLKLPHPVPMDGHFGVACLPKSKQPLPSQQLCTIIGWGKKSPADMFGTDILHEAQVPIVPSKTCREVYEEYRISANMFCAGYRGGRKDSCSGDSGGPLMCKNPAGKWTVYGITSFGEGCGKKGKYGIYARLSNYVRWIKRTIGAGSKKRPKHV